MLAVVDHGGGQSHLSLSACNRFGELTPAGTPVSIGVTDANSVAILAARRRAALNVSVARET